nr:extracellular solute-binding protein [Acidimicrobiia bacterium]
NSPEQIPAQEELASAFEEANEGSTVSFLRIPDTDEAQRRLGVLIAAGEAPEIVLPTGVFGINLYIDEGIWLDLAPQMAEAGVSLDLYEEAAVRAARATNYFGEDSDTVVGLPAAIFTHTVAYNKELFAAAGVEEPPHAWDDPAWDYDRLVEVARQLTLDGQGRTPDDDVTVLAEAVGGPGRPHGRLLEEVEAHPGLGHLRSEIEPDVLVDVEVDAEDSRGQDDFGRLAGGHEHPESALRLVGVGDAQKRDRRSLVGLLEGGRQLLLCRDLLG